MVAATREPLLVYTVLMYTGCYINAALPSLLSFSTFCNSGGIPIDIESFRYWTLICLIKLRKLYLYCKWNRNNKRQRVYSDFHRLISGSVQTLVEITWHRSFLSTVVSEGWASQIYISHSGPQRLYPRGKETLSRIWIKRKNRVELFILWLEIRVKCINSEINSFRYIQRSQPNYTVRDKLVSEMHVISCSNWIWNQIC